jgi:hypothetical protein
MNVKFTKNLLCLDIWLIREDIFSVIYGAFPVPFNECVYQLLNEYWSTGI